MARIDVLTIFPALFEPFLAESMVGIARREGLLEVERLGRRIKELREGRIEEIVGPETGPES